MILVGDVGATNTRLAWLEEEGGNLRVVKSETFASQTFKGLEEVVDLFLATDSSVVDSACFGIAGPVCDGVCDPTNLPWHVESKKLSRQFSISQVTLINDLEANAYGIFELSDDDFFLLHQGYPDANGNAALISPGTGLGEAGLLKRDGHYYPFATEGGHCDFAPRSAIQVELLQYYYERYDHVSYEHFLSGPGLENIHKFFCDRNKIQQSQWLQDEFKTKDPAAIISQNALNKKDPTCQKALALFVRILGSEAGNLVLKTLATSGLYLGGSILPQLFTPQNPNATQATLFLEAFFNKGKMSQRLKTIPIKVILNKQCPILGAARYAQQTKSK